MGYAVEALIGDRVVLAHASRNLVHAKIVSLSQQVGLLPITDALFDEVQQRGGDPFRTHTFSSFWKLSTSLRELAEVVSTYGAVAYVEADYFGGVGKQAAIVWRDQQVLLGPLSGQNAINQALRVLGIQRGEHADEFDAIALGVHRTTEDWLTELGAEG